MSVALCDDYAIHAEHAETALVTLFTSC